MDTTVLDTPEETAPVYFHKPELLPRIKSTLIDSVVVIALMMIAAAVLNQLNIQSGTVRGITLFLIPLYEPIMTSISQTLGQKIMGLRVRRYINIAEGGQVQNINIIASIFRYILKVSLGWLSLLTIHSDKYGRAIHDNVASSVMTVV